jgi:hypothetical protein
MKHLSGLGNDWPEYVGPAMLTYNAYASPNLDGMSPFELAFGRKVKIAPDIEIIPEVVVTGSFKTYHTNLCKKLAYLREHLQKFRNRRVELQNKDREIHEFVVGQIVYLFFPSGAILQTGSRKIACKFVGPLVIYKAVSPNQFLLMSLDGMVYPMLVEESRIKPGSIRTTRGNVTNLADLKQVIRSGLTLRGFEYKAENASE